MSVSHRGYADTLREYLCLPHEPEFKDIDVPATLDALISGVVAHVVVFVRLEKVLGPEVITFPQEALGRREALDTQLEIRHGRLWTTGV